MLLKKDEHFLTNTQKDDQTWEESACRTKTEIDLWMWMDAVWFFMVSSCVFSQVTFQLIKGLQFFELQKAFNCVPNYFPLYINSNHLENLTENKQAIQNFSPVLLSFFLINIFKLYGLSYKKSLGENKLVWVSICWKKCPVFNLYLISINIIS